jgi:hypothetical protein
MVGKLCEPTTEDGKKDRRKLHNEETHNLNTSQLLLGNKMNKYEKKKEYVQHIRENRYAYGVLFGKLQGKSQLG